MDDSPLECERARRALATHYDVRTFADGAALLERLAAESAPCVLVLDWLMPGVSGIEVCRFLRARPDTEALSILLLTGQNETAQIVEGLSAGANDFLTKPYADEELRARVASLVRSRQLTERAEQAERLLRKVLAHLPDAVITFDRQRRIVFANTCAERLLDAPLSELSGHSIDSLMPRLAPAKLDGLVALPDFRFHDKVLAPRVSVPPSDDEGNTTITLRDVTDSRRLEERRLDFYSMIAHDLRRPLAAMLMRTQLALRGHHGEIEEPIRQDFAKIGGAITDLVQMINDFLELARLEDAGFRMARVSLSMTELARETVEEVRPLADAKGVAVEVRADGGATDDVSGDRRRLSQVLTNLLSNAIKFTPAGGRVTVEVKTQGDTVATGVLDTGVGISEAALPLLFQRYSRVDNQPMQGTGLGLLIVRQIVEAHSGAVGVESEPGAGSRFWFSLPRQPLAVAGEPLSAALDS